jgi:hypothetical protein
VTTPGEGPAQRRLSAEERIERLDGAIAQETGVGGRLKFLTLFACGFFVFPWIVWANTMREGRVTIQVDPYGNITLTR